LLRYSAEIHWTAYQIVIPAAAKRRAGIQALDAAGFPLSRNNGWAGCWASAMFLEPADLPSVVYCGNCYPTALSISSTLWTAGRPIMRS
jgi:hypothetical protein